MHAPILSFLLLASPARATDNFPPAIQEHLGLSAAPPCLLCHDSMVGGLGTVVTPFGTTMYCRGLRPDQVDTLTRVLEELEELGVDSDGDGKGDVEEIRANDNPNSEGADFTPYECPEGATYGCLSAVSSRRPALTGWLALLAFGLMRRRRV